jgi:hypothetical protein
MAVLVGLIGGWPAAIGPLQNMLSLTTISVKRLASR